MHARHRTLLAACIVTLSSGTNYVVSAYLPQLGRRLDLSAFAMNVVSGSGSAGVYLSGPLLGWFVDARGPAPILASAAGALFLGYAGLALMYAGGEDGGIYARLGVFGLAACQVATGIGGSAGLSAALKATSQSFTSSQRGAAMATVLACFGLSAFFYSTLASAHLFGWRDPTSAFLWTLAVGCTISMVVGVVFVRPVPPATPYHLLAGPGDEAPAERANTTEQDDLDSPTDEPPESRTRSRSPLLKLREGDGWLQHHAGELDVNGWALLSERDFWMLFCLLGLCSGVGLMYINNLGTMVTTLAAAEDDPVSVGQKQASLVSLLSLMNAGGRLAIGFLADFTTHHAPDRARFARVWWLIATAGGFACSQILAGRAETSGRLAVPTMAVGFSYGTLFGLIPVVMLERFGIRDFATNNGWLLLSPSIFANFTNLLFGAVYDSNVPSPDTTPSESTPLALLARRAGAGLPARLCPLGRECFTTAFRVTTAMSLLAMGIAVSLALRPSLKPAYR